MVSADTRVSDLTVGELMEYIQARMETQLPRTLKGMKELAGYLGCSLATAQRIKSSGLIDKATHQVGRTVTFDVAKLDKIITKKYGLK